MAKYNKKYNLEYNIIYNKIQNGENCKEISLYYNCSISLIHLFCKKNNIKPLALDLVGKKFGFFTVIEKIGTKGKKGRESIFWKCECKCGNIRELPTKSINREDQISCGCYIKTKEFSRKNKHWNGYGDIHGKFWSNIIRGAKARGHDFNITIKFAWELFLKQNQKCALSGIELIFARSVREWWHGGTTASLDRIDSSKGYTEDNVQWVHKEINLMKQGLPEDRFFTLCKLIVENNK